MIAKHDLLAKPEEDCEYDVFPLLEGAFEYDEDYLLGTLLNLTVLRIRVPETPPFPHKLGGVLVDEPTRLTGAAGAGIRVQTH
jgi:hypothetical protein